MTTLTTTPHRLDRAPVALDVLIRAKQARIVALEERGWVAAANRERAELAKLEEDTRG